MFNSTFTSLQRYEVVHFSQEVTELQTNMQLQLSMFV